MKNIETAMNMAISAAEKVPEKYQIAAFTEILKSGLRAEHHEGIPEEPHDSADVDPAYSMPAAHAVAQSDSREQETMWAVMDLRKKGIEADSDAVRREIKTELGKTPQTLANTARTLRTLTPKFLRRRKKENGQGYFYEPTSHFAEIFDDGDE